ncbi:MAG TPA: CO dehydrogenase/CO-methylating acetyl-CoA synthase complex subunit beta [Elusimicrobia bacterium]|nr:CO dehydrogenase/CO-methylating acetyl-CoA synthase complex subunit beta [Elusimicrobiota bacterium]
MSELVVNLAKSGAKKIFDETKTAVENFIKQKGASSKIEFPATAFYLPIIYGLLGYEVKTAGDLLLPIEKAKKLLENENAGGLWLPQLDGALNAGISTLICEEILAAIGYSEGTEPEKGYNGFIPDNVLRSLGVQLVDGRISGIAAVIGASPDDKTTAGLISELQSKNLVILSSGSTNGQNIKTQLERENAEIGLQTYIVPLGTKTGSVIYALNFAMRAALTFGGKKKGEWQEILDYLRKRVPAFALVLGAPDDKTVALGAGAIAFGIPVIADTDVPEIGKTDVTVYEALVKETDYKKIVPKCLETRGIKVKILNIPVPVAYSAAFEGERVRRQQTYLELGGRASTAFEYVTLGDIEEIIDGKIEVIGPEIDDIKEGGSLPLAIFIEVAGRKMQKEFESIVERQIHTFLNEAQGVMHTGQRDLMWLRISKDAKSKGFKLKHLGTIVHARIHEVFGTIVDKVQVKIYTNEEDVKRLLPAARASYKSRDDRMGEMTDESVDTFYSCLLCQSFAPNHVCIVKPERPGLCGGYNWLDCKTSFEVNPTGPNQPVKKGKVLDEKYGEWESVNEFVKEKSHSTIERFHGYSIMTFPETSCGCFECIGAIVPEASGFMVVNREYMGMTPLGMTFSTLAGSVGGGVQTPGFMGFGRLYITSKKFIKADGGLKRIVWMPKELKEALADKIKVRAAEEGVPDLFDKIADETIASDTEKLLEFLQKVNHPVLTMDPLM